MQPYLEKTYLQPAGDIKGTTIYKLAGGNLANSYYIVSNKGTRKLLSSPEVIGYDSYLAMTDATSDMIGCLKQDNTIGTNVDIMTILRGGLNYPLEECCYRNGVRVTNMDFISCERIIHNNHQDGIEEKNRQFCPAIQRGNKRITVAALPGLSERHDSSPLR